MHDVQLVKTDSMGQTRQTAEERDVFKEKPYRYLGYANEVGESFRHLVPRMVVNGSYAVSSAYVLTHALYVASRKDSDDSPVISMVDTLLWQGLASVAIPGLTINRICASTRWLLDRTKVMTPQSRSLSVMAAGLFSIPLIVNPIDRFVDRMLNRLVRPYYRDNPQP